ncbi:MAG: hypothetical protein ACTSUE_17085 [Promethearchaeota archaeon]
MTPEKMAALLARIEQSNNAATDTKKMKGMTQSMDLRGAGCLGMLLSKPFFDDTGHPKAPHKVTVAILNTDGVYVPIKPSDALQKKVAKFQGIDKELGVEQGAKVVAAYDSFEIKEAENDGFDENGNAQTKVVKRSIHMDISNVHLKPQCAITLKIFRPDPTLKPGMIVKLVGVSYSLGYNDKKDEFYYEDKEVREVVKKNFNVAKILPVHSVPNSVMDGLPKATFFVNPKDAKLPDENAPYSEKWGPNAKRTFVIPMDQHMTNAKFKVEMTKIMEGRGNDVLYGTYGYVDDSSRVILTDDDGNKSMAFVTGNKIMPVLVTVTQITETGESRMYGYILSFYENTVKKFGIHNIDEWEGCGPHLLNANKGYYIGRIDVKKTEKMPEQSEDTMKNWDFVMRLRGDYYPEHETVVERAGIPLDVEDAIKFVPELANGNTRLASPEWETSVFNNNDTTRAVNVKHICGDVGNLLKAAKKGKAQFYVVCNHNLDDDDLQDIKDLETSGERLDALMRKEGSKKMFHKKIKKPIYIVFAVSQAPILSLLSDSPQSFVGSNTTAATRTEPPKKRAKIEDVAEEQDVDSEEEEETPVIKKKKKRKKKRKVEEESEEEPGEEPEEEPGEEPGEAPEEDPETAPETDLGEISGVDSDDEEDEKPRKKSTSKPKPKAKKRQKVEESDED